MVTIELDEVEIQALLHMLRVGRKPSLGLKNYLIEKLEKSLRQLIRKEAVGYNTNE